MAFTRDDNVKIRCRVNKYNNNFEYMLNVPGNGVTPKIFAVHPKDYVIARWLTLQQDIP